MERAPGELASEYDRRNVTGSGPYQVELAGGLGEVRLPDLCAHCAGAPAGTLRLHKMFRRVHRDSPTTYLIDGLSVPFCRDCIAAHEALRQPPDPRELRRLRNRWILSTLPYWIPIGVLSWMIVQFLSNVRGAIVAGDRIELLVWLGIVLLLALGLLAFLRHVLAGRRRQIADHGGDPDDQYVEIARGLLGVTCVLPGPPTPTLAAVNFSDEDVELFDRNRRTFTFTNLEVATAFAATNADLVYLPNSPRAIRARWGRNVVLALVVGVGLVVMLMELMGG